VNENLRFFNPAFRFVKSPPLAPPATFYLFAMHVPRLPEASTKEAKSYVPVERDKKGEKEGGKVSVQHKNDPKKETAQHSHHTSHSTYHE